MDLEMVLNECSLATPAPNQDIARQWMSELLYTVREATKFGAQRTLRTSREINALEISTQYPVAGWRNDRLVDKELIRFFKSLVTKAPFYEDAADTIKDKLSLIEVSCSGKKSVGLAFAYLTDNLVVSFHSEAIWDQSCLELNVTFVDAIGELVEGKTDIAHASQVRHVQEIRDWITKRVRQSIADGQTLWDQRTKLFLRLEFCESVYQQIKNLGVNDPVFRQVVKKLFELQEYCDVWEEGAFDAGKLASKATPESRSRLQNPRLNFSFLCPDGVKRIFEWHIRITPDAWRLHFYPDSIRRVIIIGYIGRKIQ